MPTGLSEEALEQRARATAVRKGKQKLKETLQQSLSAVSCLFQMLDTDGSGEIDRSEFRQAAAALGLSGVTPEAADALFSDFDVTGDGAISYHEYLRYAIRDALARSSSKVAPPADAWPPRTAPASRAPCVSGV